MGVIKKACFLSESEKKTKKKTKTSESKVIILKIFPRLDTLPKI